MCYFFIRLHIIGCITNLYRYGYEFECDIGLYNDNDSFICSVYIFTSYIYKILAIICQRPNQLNAHAVQYFITEYIPLERYVCCGLLYSESSWYWNPAHQPVGSVNIIDSGQVNFASWLRQNLQFCLTTLCYNELSLYNQILDLKNWILVLKLRI